MRRSVPELWVPLVMMAIIGTFAFNFTVVMPLFVKRTLGGTDTTFTLIYSVVSVGSLVGALFTARRRATTVRHVDDQRRRLRRGDAGASPPRRACGAPSRWRSASASAASCS